MPSLRECKNASSDHIICPQFISVRGFNSGATSHLIIYNLKIFKFKLICWEFYKIRENSARYNEQIHVHSLLA